MLARTAVQTALMLAVLGAILLGCAGTVHWTEAWVFLVGMGGVSMTISVWLKRHDPALMQSRLSSPFARNQTRRDTALIVGIGLGFLGWIAVIGLDRRFGWSGAPAGVEIVGGLVVLVGFGGVWWTFAVNSFAAPQIRIQTERGQTVVTAGPYRYVRHPMYAASALYLVGVALLLGSWVGVAGAMLLTAAFGVRALGEERMLRLDLEGYDAYARQVRWRLLPGVW